MNIFPKHTARCDLAHASRSLLLCSLAGLSFTSAQAAEAESSPWTGRLGAGVVATSGNSQSRSQSAEYQVQRAVDGEAWLWRSTGKLLQVRSQVEVTDAASGESFKQSQTTAESYQLGLRAERRIDAENFLYADAAFFKDLFGSTRTSTTQTVGYGRRLLATERRTLDAELGLGARQLEQQIDRRSNDEFIAQAALRLDLALGDSSRFGQSVQVEYGAENTITQAASRLKLSIFGAFWAQIGFDLRHNSVAEPGQKATDTTSSLSLLWEFPGR